MKKLTRRLAVVIGLLVAICMFAGCGSKEETAVKEDKEKVETEVKEAKDEAETKAEEVKDEAETKAEEVKDEAETKAEEVKDEAETKAEEVKDEAETKAEEVKDEAETKAEEVKDEVEEKAGELEKIKVAYMPNYASLATFAGAVESGAFEEEGFDVELVEFADGPTIISAMENGSIDYAYIGTGAHKLCIQGRADIICFAQLSNADAVIGNADKGIKTAADLKGKKVAFSSGTSSEEILKATLGKADLTMDDIEAMDMDASAITTAMISGSVDACATWSPNTLTIYTEMGDKAVELGCNKDFTDTTVSVSSFIAMPDKVKNNREQVVRFVKALLIGSDYRSVDENFENNCKRAAELTGLALESMTGCKLDAEWLSGDQIIEIVDNGEMKGYYETQQKAFLESGAIEAEVPVEDYVHFDIMKEAYDK